MHTQMSSPTLSKRTEILHGWEDFLIKYLLLCDGDEYHPEKNKNGYINLGTAVNNICNDILYPKITDSKIWSCDTDSLQYKVNHGSPRIREAFAALMTEFLKTASPVNPENLYFFAGVTGCLDVLAHCLADPGDVILAPTPIYGRIYTDFIQRGLVELWPIPIITKDSTEEHPVLTFNKVLNAYFEAKKHGKTVKAIILLNPSNPLGDVYDSELVMSILEFCHEVELHVVIDEVYALSVFDGKTEFQSVLSFPYVPDPYSTHVLYGLSKDFAIAGLRIGVIHTLNTTLQKCFIQLSALQNIPYPVMTIAAQLVEDLEFCKNFISINQKRLREKFELCRKYLQEIDIPVRNSAAAFFLWVSLRDKCGISTFEKETAFFHYMIESHHLYIVPGKELFCEQPGWFRISFTGRPDHVEVGLERFKNAVNNYKEIELQSCTERACASASAQDPDQEDTLESLVLLLRNQIVASDWLSLHDQGSNTDAAH